MRVIQKRFKIGEAQDEMGDMMYSCQTLCECAPFTCECDYYVRIYRMIKEHSGTSEVYPTLESYIGKFTGFIPAGKYVYAVEIAEALWPCFASFKEAMRYATHVRNRWDYLKSLDV